MKKLAILLSLVMVLGLAASAMAADLSTSGYLKYGFNKTGDQKLFTSFSTLDWRVTLKAKVDDTLSGAIQFDDDGAEVSVGRAYATKDFGAFSVTAGKQTFYSGDNVGTFFAGLTGVSAKVPFSMGNVKAMLVPGMTVADNEKPDFYLAGDISPIEGLTLYGDFGMTMANVAATEYDKAWAVEAAYDVAGFTVYGEVAESNDASDGFEGMAFGATTSISGFDLTGQYNAKVGGNEVKTFDVTAETTIGGVLYGVEYITDDDYTTDDDAVLKGYAKVSF